MYNYHYFHYKLDYILSNKFKLNLKNLSIHNNSLLFSGFFKIKNVSDQKQPTKNTFYASSKS